MPKTNNTKDQENKIRDSVRTIHNDYFPLRGGYCDCGSCRADYYDKLTMYIKEQIEIAVEERDKEIVEMIEKETDFDHTKCPIKESCIGYQSAVSDILNLIQNK